MAVMVMDIGTILTGLMVGVIQTMGILHIGALVMVGDILIMADIIVLHFMADITALTTTTATVMEIILHTTEEEEIQHIFQAEVPIGIVQIKMQLEEILTRALK